VAGAPDAAVEPTEVVAPAEVVAPEAWACASWLANEVDPLPVVAVLGDVVVLDARGALNALWRAWSSE
jgi:hypothetical protein